MLRIWSICVLCFLGLTSMWALLANLDSAEARGKHIYLHGSSTSTTPITATLGDDPSSIPGSAFACVNCHGRNGQGKPEGGVVPSDIQWLTLTKPYEFILPAGRKRGPYTESSLKRAITLGFDPSNNTLSAAMPRFQMTQNDIADLITYMKLLGRDNDPGVADDHLRIGVILPPRRMAQMHNSIKSVLEAYFDGINRQGGIFGRRIEEIFLDYPEDAAARRDIVRDFLNKDIFALTSSFIAGDEAGLTPIFQQTETPVLAAYTLYPQTSAPLNPLVFYLDEGLLGQIKALLSFAKRLPKTSTRPVVVYSDSAPSRQLLDLVEHEFQSLGLSLPVRVAVANPDMLTVNESKKIHQAGNSFVLFLQPPSKVLRDVHHLGETNQGTAFLVPGALLENNSFNPTSTMGMHIFVAYSGGVPGLSENAAAEYSRLVKASQAKMSTPSEQWPALAGAKIMVEALKRSGHDLNREAFIKALEGLSNFENGFAAPVTYGPNQRVGNTQIQIMSVDRISRRLIVENAN